MRKRVPRVEARAVATSCCWPIVRLDRGGARGQREADVVEDLLAGLDHAAVTQQAEARLLVAEEEIGGHRQMRAKHHLLVHGVDAEADRLVGGGERDRAAFPQDLARGPLVHAGQRLDECRLAGPVLADDGVDLARQEVEVDALQRMGGAKAFVEFLQGQDGRGRCRTRRGRSLERVGRHGIPLAIRVSPARQAWRSMLAWTATDVAPPCG